MEGGSCSDEEKKSPVSGGGGGGGIGGGEPKTKRKMNTLSQIEVLEKTYQVATYPSEALRAELSVKLGLTDRNLQMWFCHRRLKDRKLQSAGGSGSGKRAKKGAAAAAATATVSPPAVVTQAILPAPVGPKDEMLGAELGNEHGSGSQVIWSRL
ncbi:homeobox-DDT domain protein RLT2-like [Chenopodium quinoa]|uniref:homeobox-DDT domain protein RLT2-like n=1 Tax=Chenopodium quinoa TaxID=63459 RepID=UPI000B795D9D|nr:homeobox-DDT domain protein RLT2-like [Chenopodium quinoa]